MQKIKELVIVSNEWFKYYSVGGMIEGIEITSIDDRGKEYPDSIEFVFHIKSGEKIIAEIINCPVEIRYFI